MLEGTFGGTEKLCSHIGGIFVAGGGFITREQCFLWRLRDAGRPGDYFVPAKTLDGRDSPLNLVLATGYLEEAQKVADASKGRLSTSLQTLYPPSES